MKSSLFILVLIALFSVFAVAFEYEAFDLASREPSLLELENSLEALGQAIAAGEVDESVLDEADLDLDMEAEDEMEAEFEEAALETSEFYLEAYKKFCGVTCKTGYKAQTRAGYKASANGCGAGGDSWLAKTIVKAPASFVKCCNGHDYCYGTCGSSRDSCDKTFANCLNKAVQAITKKTSSKRTLMEKICVNLKLNKVFTQAVVSLGCSAFKASQQDACVCQKA